uniref:DUF4408 domain-containing protein n=1 Tax=Daucus carota subsp. sativus TaxID=79200 RepID=A0A175YJM0_DAUCS
MDTNITSWFTPTLLFFFLNLIIISIFIASYSRSHKHQLVQHDSVPNLNRSSSLLARVKSLNFSFRNFEHHYPETLLTDPQNEHHHVPGEVSHEDAHVPATTEEKLSASEPLETVSLKENKEQVMKESKEQGDEQVDAKAENFINRFKQQLKMQRLDSIKRYTDMLTRGPRSTN